MANAFRHDPAFPRSSFCAVIDSPEVDLAVEVVSVVLPEAFPGEFDIIHDALELTCAASEGNLEQALLAVLGIAAAVGVAVAARRRQPRRVAARA